jgi:hypothetical protein
MRSQGCGLQNNAVDAAGAGKAAITRIGLFLNPSRIRGPRAKLRKELAKTLAQATERLARLASRATGKEVIPRSARALQAANPEIVRATDSEARIRLTNDRQFREAVEQQLSIEVEADCAPEDQHRLAIAKRMVGIPSKPGDDPWKYSTMMPSALARAPKRMREAKAASDEGTDSGGEDSEPDIVLGGVPDAQDDTDDDDDDVVLRPGSAVHIRGIPEYSAERKPKRVRHTFAAGAALSSSAAEWASLPPPSESTSTRVLPDSIHITPGGTHADVMVLTAESPSSVLRFFPEEVLRLRARFGEMEDPVYFHQRGSTAAELGIHQIHSILGSVARPSAIQLGGAVQECPVVPAVDEAAPHAVADRIASAPPPTGWQRASEADLPEPRSSVLSSLPPAVHSTFASASARAREADQVALRSLTAPVPAPTLANVLDYHASTATRLRVQFQPVLLVCWTELGKEQGTLTWLDWSTVSVIAPLQLLQFARQNYRPTSLSGPSIALPAPPSHLDVGAPPARVINPVYPRPAPRP